MKHIFLWASRTGVGQIYTTRTRSGSGPSRAVRTYKRSRGVRLGLFVGGPGSRLQYGGGGATAKQFRGRRRVSVTYQTRGGKSEFLPAGKVGAPILQETVKRHGREAARAFVVGFSRGR